MAIHPSQNSTSTTSKTSTTISPPSNRPVELLARLLLGLIGRLDLATAQRLGSLVGWLLWRIPNRARAVAERNLTLCWPRLSPARRQRLLQLSLRETGKAIAESGLFWFGPPALWEQRLQVEGEDALRTALAQGQRVIAITPHLGAWELMGLYLSRHYPMATLYHPAPGGVNKVVRQGRARFGAQLVPTTATGIRQLARSLAKGRLVGVLPDHDPGRERGIFAAFFGLAAKTMTLLPRLARHAEVTVFMTHARRLPRGRGFRLAIVPLPATLWQASLLEATTAVNAEVEALIRRYPGQYLWAYKRFKTTPPGEPRRYP